MLRTVSRLAVTSEIGARYLLLKRFQPFFVFWLVHAPPKKMPGF
jgi:hypothetical protein